MHRCSQNAAPSVKPKWKVTIRPRPRPQRDIEFQFLVKDATQGGQVNSDTLFVRAGLGPFLGLSAIVAGIAPTHPRTAMSSSAEIAWPSTTRRASSRSTWIVDQLSQRRQLSPPIHVDRDEARTRRRWPGDSADEDMAVRDVSGRAGTIASDEKRNRGRSTNSVSELTCAPWASFTRN